MSSEFAKSTLSSFGKVEMTEEYKPLVEIQMAQAKKRQTTTYQTPEEVAKLVADLIENTNPPFRMRTSTWGEHVCRFKTSADPCGLLQK